MAASGLSSAIQAVLARSAPFFSKKNVGFDLPALLAVKTDVDGLIKCIKKRVQHSDLTDADGNEQEAFAALSNIIFLGAYVKLDAAFGGGTSSAVTAGIGVAADGDALADDVNVFTGQTLERKDGVSTVQARFYKALTAVVDINVTGDTCLALTSGDLTAYLFYIQATDLEALAT